jgi:uncharacterized membrane protein YdbT with pleckstrin-like domain
VLDARMSWLGALMSWKTLITFGVWLFVNRYATRYQVTDQRVYRRYGLISKTENTVSRDDIREVELRQGIIGRLFRYGTVRVSTAGTAGSEIDFRKVGNPAKVQQRIENMRAS